jgi:hypothetical protein
MSTICNFSGAPTIARRDALAGWLRLAPDVKPEEVSLPDDLASAISTASLPQGSTADV